MSFEEFQDGRCGHWKGANLAVLNLHVSPMPPTKFQLNRLTVWEQMSFQDFQDGHHGHLGYWNRMNLAILNLYVTPMPPAKLWLNLTFHSGADMV